MLLSKVKDLLSRAQSSANNSPPILFALLQARSNGLIFLRPNRNKVTSLVR